MSAGPYDNAFWDAYNAGQSGRGPRVMVRKLLDLAGPGDGREALDLGAGAGIESVALLRDGWRVTAVDPAPGTADLPVPAGLRDRFAAQVSTIQEAVPLTPSDLVHASYALPFVPPGAFDAVWADICRSLRPGGWLAVTIFGPKDTWASDPEHAAVMTFRSRDQLEVMMDGLDVLDVVEEDEEGRSTTGPKHWHLFEVIARRPDAR